MRSTHGELNRRSPRLNPPARSNAEGSTTDAEHEFVSLVISDVSGPVPELPSDAVSSQLSFSQSGDTTILTIPRHSLLSIKHPCSNLEALFLHKSPHILDESLTIDLSHAERASHSRQSLNPLQPSGTSQSLTDKREKLVQIIKSDPELRTNGINIQADPRLLLDLQRKLTSRLQYQRDPQFLAQWYVGLLAEEELLQTTPLTDETTIIGVFRGTVYNHCNRFIRHPLNFVESCREAIQNCSWGDPPNTTVSRLDVAGWHRTKFSCGAEHKREEGVRRRGAEKDLCTGGCSSSACWR